MNQSKRGTVLTVFAVLLVLLAVEDLLKPFLLFYASTIWRMNRTALYIAFCYAIYVTLNLFLFTMKYPAPTTRGDQIFGIVYSILALALSWGLASMLARRKADLT